MLLKRSRPRARALFPMKSRSGPAGIYMCLSILPAPEACCWNWCRTCRKEFSFLFVPSVAREPYETIILRPRLHLLLFLFRQQTDLIYSSSANVIYRITQELVSGARVR